MPSAARMEEERSRRTFVRGTAYGLLAAGLILGVVPLRNAGWSGSVTLHTLMEVTATFLAAVAGVVALIHFYTQRNTFFLFIGIGFIGTALLDGYHAVITGAGFASLWPSPPPHLGPWSWNVSRTYLSILMFLSWWAWYREARKGKSRLSSGRAVFAITGTLTLASFFFIVLVPLPPAYYAGFLFTRPGELVPALFFGAAVVGYLRNGTWRVDPFAHWVVLSLIVGFLAQALFMSLSQRPHDGMFTVGHLLKQVSYVLVLVGLFISMAHLFRTAERSARNFRKIVESSPTATLVADASGRIRIVNPALERLFGYAADDLEGEQVEKLVPEAHRPGHPEHREGYFSKPEVRPMAARSNLSGLRRDGTLVPVDIVLSPVELDGQQMVLAGITDLRALRRVEGEVRGLNDTLESRIQERTHALEHSRGEAVDMMRDAKAAQIRAERAENQLRIYSEELRRSNADLENFAYVASHDLKSPLRAIDSLSKWLSEDLWDKLDENSREQLRLLRGRVSRMEAMIEGLLQYSRAGRKRYDEEDVAVGDLVSEIRETIDLPESFTLTGPEKAPTLRTQKPALQQVLVNLITNAVKHHDRPDGRVEVRCRENGEYVEFAVSDDGPGILERYHGKIFEMFQTLQSRDRKESTGIGLALVKRILDRVGGKIGVYSGAGRGTEFRFQWPKAGVGREEA